MMKLRSYVMTAVFLLALWMHLPSFAAVKEHDWCTVEYPAEISGNQRIEIKVTPKNGIPAGYQVGCHLHWFKVDGWGGFLSWQASKPAVAGKPVVIPHMVKGKPGMVKINAVVFLAPDGDFKNATKKADQEILFGASSGGAAGAAAPAAGESEKKEFDWCTVETPKNWVPGTPIEVKVKIKDGVPAGQKVGSHLHWHRADVWGGFASYQEPKAATPGATYVFRHKPGDKEGLSHFNSMVFLSPDGDFNKKTKICYAEIKKGSAPAAAASATAKATQELDWCTIETPTGWVPGTPLEVKVKIKDGVPAGQKVGSHLHWHRADAWGGFASYQEPKDATPGATYVFRHKPGNKEGLHHFNSMVFLAPGGDFNKKTKNSNATVNVIASGSVAGASSYPARPESIKFKKSSLWFVKTEPKEVHVGDTLKVTMGYYLDPSETWGEKDTYISCQPLGPWIDNPDGVINKGRMHVNYGSLWTKEIPVKPGRGEVTFEWRLNGSFRYNSCFFLSKFNSPDRKGWPWDVRGGSANIMRNYAKTFMLTAEAVGGLFRYSEVPRIRLDWGKSAPAPSSAESTVTVRDYKGNVVLKKTVAAAPSGGSMTIELPGITQRGVFSVTVDVPGVGSDYTFFGTYPDFPEKTASRYPFGVTDIGSPEISQLAANLGFTHVRHFIGWGGLEGKKDQYTLDGLEKRITSNTDAGLKPWISLQGAPSWALPEGMFGFGFEPAPVDLAQWAEIITEIATRFKGKLYGFEWLNEIVPGTKAKDPVQCYLDICRVGTAAAKKVDPKLVIQLAGGLWPHNFRIDLLNAGVGKYIDILPVHYSTYAGVNEALRDLAVRDIKNVSVIDNETAAGMTVWNMNAQQTFDHSIDQCKHVMQRWPDVRIAGSEMIVYFGGSPQATGNWTYLLDDNTPRPVAVTLAVVQGKLAYAKPVAKFYMGSVALHYFEDADGKPFAFVSAPGVKGGASVTLPAAGNVLTLTDFQGNISSRPAAQALHVGDMPVIVEGLDRDMMRLHAAASVGTSPLPQAVPTQVSEPNPDLQVPVRVMNPYATKKTFTLSGTAAAWGTCPAKKVTLAPGQSTAVELYYVPEAGKKASATSDLKILVSVSGVSASVEKPFTLYSVDSSAAGNLLKNGDFEAGTDGKGCPGWNGNGFRSEVPGEPGNHALKLPGTGNYAQVSQMVEIPVPGQTYLYTAWVWSKTMDAGSNIGEYFKSTPKPREYYMPQVFSTGHSGTASWRFLVKKFNTSADTSKLRFQPVGRGNKSNDVWTLYDNICVSLYKGSDFVAFAPRSGKTLDSGDAGVLIPLLCDNQITENGGYKWTPESLGGTAKFTWDETALMFEASVKDDVLSTVSVPMASESGLETLKGDSIALCIYPKMGVEGPTNDQIRWYISKASPGGGSGTCTVFRPSAYSLGAKPGQLAKDSSVYAVSITREGNMTKYSLKIPWTEIPGFSPAKGASFGCNIILNDKDNGSGTGSMTWGTSLRDSASDCGLVTLMP